ncbi:MAG: hypothetical protein ACOC7L_03730 [Acidobacteriota bacterium]
MNPSIAASPRTVTRPLAVALLLAAAACGPGEGTGERVEEAQETAAEEAAEGPLAASALGTFQLSLTGDLEEELQGEAVCSVGVAASELRVVMRGTETPERMIVLQVPEYERTGTYDGTVQVSGAERATGPAEVAVSSVVGEAGVLEDQIAVAFRGTYAGGAGSGEMEGEARCTPGEPEPSGS